MSEQNKESKNIEGEVLLEKVREIELAKNKDENSEEKDSDKNNTAKILNEKRVFTAPMTEAEAKKICGTVRAARF